jgi:hypothetical protein
MKREALEIKQRSVTANQVSILRDSDMTTTLIFLIGRICEIQSTFFGSVCVMQAETRKMDNIPAVTPVEYGWRIITR